MDILTWLQTNLHINGVIVLIVIAAGYFQNSYTKDLHLSKDDKTNSALKTLLISGLVVSIMLVFQQAKRDEIWDAFLSYFLATSFYELLVRPITKFIQSKIGDGN